MPDVPEEAVTPAVAAYAREAYVDGEPIEGDERVIRAALEAAAPVLAEHIAKAILAHMERHWPPERQTAHSPRRHLRIAAQVAANAFYTDEDMKRLAAEAIARGDMIACRIPDGEADA